MQRRIFIESEITPTHWTSRILCRSQQARVILSRTHGSLYLSEILAINNSTRKVGSNFPDVIEIHNTSAFPKNLGEMSLSDDSVRPDPIYFPP